MQSLLSLHGLGVCVCVWTFDRWIQHLCACCWMYVRAGPSDNVCLCPQLLVSARLMYFPCTVIISVQGGQVCKSVGACVCKWAISWVLSGVFVYAFTFYEHIQELMEKSMCVCACASAGAHPSVTGQHIIHPLLWSSRPWQSNLLHKVGADKIIHFNRITF